MRVLSNDSQEKTLYTRKEIEYIERLLKIPYSETIENELGKIQQFKSKREARIARNQTTKEDLKQGFTREKFPWIRRFK